MTMHSSLLESQRGEWRALLEIDDGFVGESMNMYGPEADITNAPTGVMSLAPNSTQEVDTYDDFYNNKWLLILPKVTGVISLVAIVCVAMEAWSDLTKEKRSAVIGSNRTLTATARNASTVTHIQLFYQIPLFCLATVCVLGTLPVPQGERWGAFGNTATCSFQGFLMQFAVYACMGWDTVLSATYISMVCYTVGAKQLQTWRKYFHLFIWPLSLALSIYPLVKGMYNVYGTACWINTYPAGCVGEDCIRGEGAAIWQILLSGVVLIHMLYSFTVMICLYCSIRGLEDQRYASSGIDSRNGRCANDALDRSASSGTTNDRRRCSRAIGIQGMLYAGGILFTCIPQPLTIFLWNVFGIWNDGFAIFAVTLLPLLGYANFVVFMRQRSVERCNTSYAKFLRRAHGWIFDYRLVCHFQDIWKDSRERSTKHTETPRRAESCPTRGSARICQREASQSKLPVILEDGAPDDECQGRPGRWTSFVDLWKHLSHSRCASELTVSGLSDFEAIDRPPSLPVRIRSDVEKAPVRPVRLASELDDVDTSRSKQLRCSMETSANPKQCLRSSQESSEIGDESRFSLASYEIPPGKLPHFVGEEVLVESDFLSSVKPKAKPPSKPRKGELKAPEVDLPPAMPMRYMSEAETPEAQPASKSARVTDDSYTTEFGSCPSDLMSHGSELNEWETRELVLMPSTLMRPAREAEAHEAQTRPFNPAGLVSDSNISAFDSSPANLDSNVSKQSELEAPVFELPSNMPERYMGKTPGDHTHVSKPVGLLSASNAIGFGLSPSNLMSSVSELEVPEFDVAPSKPKRYNSEMELLDAS